MEHRSYSFEDQETSQSSGEEESSQSSDEESSYDDDDDDDDDDDYAENREDGSNGHNSPKRQKTEETLDETLKQDRIGAMPYAILIHILSFLPTEEAVRTGVLSKRWLYLWTSVPNLVFLCSYLRSRLIRRFVSFVDQTLIFHRCPNIKKFVVSFRYKESYSSRIDAWVRFATRANVEELCLVLEDMFNYSDNDHYILPQHVCVNSSITKLTLSVCDFVPNVLISWKSLKSLTIGYSNFSEDLIQKILIGCPLLEFLDLHGFRGLNRLDIGSGSLRELLVRDYWDYAMHSFGDPPPPMVGEGPELEISLPNVQSLGILGTMYGKKVKLMDVQSLVDCNLSYSYILDDNPDYEVYGNKLREHLDKLSHVKKFTVGSWCIQVLSKLAMKGLFFPESKCECLTLTTYVMKYDVPGIVGLLQSSPHLQTLVINMSSFMSPKCQFNEPLEEWSFKCVMPCLKTVKIVGFSPWHCGVERAVIQLVEFLLESARVLEKMVIKVRKDDGMEYSPKELLQVSQRLLSLPRSSPCAVVIFSE